MAVLWEGVRDDPAQVKARLQVINSVTEILDQVDHWQQAARLHREAKGEAMDIA